MFEECGKDMCHVEVSNRNVIYRLDLHKRITIVRGDSGTGKTALYELMEDYAESPMDSGINVSSDKPCDALLYEDWEHQLSDMHDCVVFLGEYLYYLIDTKELAEAMLRTDNHYVLCTRENIPTLPEDAVEICEMKANGREHWLMPVSTENGGSSEKA